MTLPNRYHRQTLLPDIGEAGQARLATAHAAIVGVGALGTTSAQLLARAGVGRITIIDRDVVEATNLQRQTLYTETDATEGVPKAVAAERALRAMNSEIEIVAYAADFNHANASNLFGLGTDERPGVLIDGTDNLHTRYLLNDLAVREGIPYCYAGAVGTHGMLLTVLPVETPCLRCLFPDPPDPGTVATCDTAGVLGPVVSAVASLQAAEAMKILLGRTDLVARTMRSMDPWTNAWREFDPANARDPECPCCGRRSFEFADGVVEIPGAKLCGRNAVQIAPPSAGREIDLAMMESKLRPLGEVTANAFLLRCALRDEPFELTLFPDGRAIIGGTEDESRARSVYAKYVGG